MRESAKALQAFNDYFALGAKRSLGALLEMYRTQTEPKPPTRNICTLKNWSRTHGWQARVEARVREQNQAVWEKIKRNVATEKAKDYRRIERALKMAEEQIEAGAVPATLSEMEKLIRRKYSLMGQPLPERIEHTGRDGEPISVRHEIGEILLRIRRARTEGEASDDD